MPGITEKSPDYTKLHHDGVVTTSYITCSAEAAEYAYKHYATPYEQGWRAASAGYDAGVAAAKETK